MPVYDDQDQKHKSEPSEHERPLVDKDDEFEHIVNKNYTADELQRLEDDAVKGAAGDYYNEDDSLSGEKRLNRAIGEDELADIRGRDNEAEEAEEEQLQDKLKDYFTEDGKAEINANANSLFGTKRSRRALIASLGVGMSLAAVLLAFLPGLLSILKLENFLQNIDASTYSRLNAMFDRRSDKWIKSYIKLRLSEIEGETDPNQKVLFFRGSSVDTDNPIRDWYRTLRLNGFDEKIFKENGITIQSALVKQGVELPDGSICKQKVCPRLAVVTIKSTQGDVNFDFDPIKEFGNGDFDVASANINKIVTGLESGDIAQLNNLGNKLDTFVDVKLYPDSSSARKAIKTIVNDKTQPWQVFKRRHLRKDYANLTGIRSWRLFETTRDKFDEKLSNIQTKIMEKVLPEGKMGLLIGCVLGANDCAKKSDPNSKEAQDPRAATLARADEDPNARAVDANGDPIDTVDGNGNTVPAQDGSFNARAATDELTDAAEKGIKNEVEGEVEDVVKQTFLKELRDMIGNVYSKIWPTLKKIARVHEFFHNNVLGSFIVNSRRAQYMGAYASMAIALSQIKSGDVRNITTPTESTASTTNEFGSTTTNIFSAAYNATQDGQINQYMSFFDDAERSEGWILFSGGRQGNNDVAKAAADVGRDAYCDMSDSEKRAAPVYYLCPDDGLNGNAGDDAKAAYDASAGKLLGPIANAVNSVNDSVLGKALNLFSSFGNNIEDKTIGPIVEKILDVTGGGELIGNVAMAGITKALAFAGAGIKYTPELAGQLNYMLLGASAGAEASARQGGAAATTSLTRAYSDQVAADWKAEQKTNLSTFDRFASLSNPKSFASRTLLAIFSSSPKQSLQQITDPGKTVSGFASSLQGITRAAETDIDAHSVAEWGGVKTYDYPQQCIDLDPLSPDYFNQATNAPAAVPRTREVMTNQTAFWDAVYAALPDNDAEEATAETVYNCALLDQRVMGGLGYTSGFTNDGGLESGLTSTVGQGSGDPGAPSLNGYTIPCTGESRSVVRKTPGNPSVDWTGIPDSGSIGSDSTGQPIKVYIRAACSTENVKTVVIVSSIHGSENGGQMISFELLFNAPLPSNVRIVAIPELNSSSIEIGRRKNANGVDLNRNNDYQWSTLTESDETSPSGTFYRGSAPASEPETKAINNYLSNTIGKANLFLIYHDNLFYVAPVGNTIASLAQTYASASGMHGQCPGDNANPSSTNCAIRTVTQRGSLDAWYNSKTGTPSLLVEMSSDQSASVIAKHVDAVRAVIGTGL